jgi:2-oxoglutarate dehydrogenase E2 component (dihydrolipoamide succinyltransferase)
MLTTFNEIDMSAVMAIRESHEQRRAFKSGTGRARLHVVLRQSQHRRAQGIPQVNAELQGDELVSSSTTTSASPSARRKGWSCPCARRRPYDVCPDRARPSRRYAKKAKGTLSLDDLRGGTFTITNGGVFGSLLSTPILNPPQVGILGMHKIEQRPVAVNGEVVIRPMMYVALSYDHRVIDGREAVQFLVKG